MNISVTCSRVRSYLGLELFDERNSESTTTSYWHLTVVTIWAQPNDSVEKNHKGARRVKSKIGEIALEMVKMVRECHRCHWFEL
uniref:Uncharacterized protein n=1 Tax=Nelumbo nucifera TaxID=4432 RepID=A0A822ZFZ3_NELNU|nr:TPA_asm: hypothetical protein HUJ06_001650 [Nelumbo nucifera]